LRSFTEITLSPLMLVLLVGRLAAACRIGIEPSEPLKHCQLDER